MAPGARSKFGALMFEPEIFRKQIYHIEECACGIFRTFRRHRQSFGSPTVIRCAHSVRRPENYDRLATPLGTPQVRGQSILEKGQTKTLGPASVIWDKFLKFGPKRANLAPLLRSATFTAWKTKYSAL